MSATIIVLGIISLYVWLIVQAQKWSTHDDQETSPHSEDNLITFTMYLLAIVGGCILAYEKNFIS